MGGCRCTYRDCEHNSTTPNIKHFFHYPINDSERCEKWIQYAQKTEYFHIPISKLRNRVVCERHFKERCFMNIRNERLTKTAIPTITRLDNGEIIDHEKEIIDTIEVTAGQDDNHSSDEDKNIDLIIDLPSSTTKTISIKQDQQKPVLLNSITKVVRPDVEFPFSMKILDTDRNSTSQPDVKNTIPLPPSSTSTSTSASASASYSSTSTPPPKLLNSMFGSPSMVHSSGIAPKKNAAPTFPKSSCANDVHDNGVIFNDIQDKIPEKKMKFENKPVGKLKKLIKVKKSDLNFIVVNCNENKNDIGSASTTSNISSIPLKKLMVSPTPVLDVENMSSHPCISTVPIVYEKTIINKSTSTKPPNLDMIMDQESIIPSATTATATKEQIDLSIHEEMIKKYTNEIDELKTLLENKTQALNATQKDLNEQKCINKKLALWKQNNESKITVNNNQQQQPQPTTTTATIPTSTMPLAATATKAQIFNGIKKYLNPSMVALLRMEVFGNADREYKPDEKSFAKELFQYKGNNIYQFLQNEWRFRLPSGKQVELWLNEDNLSSYNNDEDL